MSASKVWVYPERTFEKLGAERYLLSWEEVRPDAKGKTEIDPDRDIIYRHAAFFTKEHAIADGRKLVDAYKTAFGQATVVKQVVDWFEENDRVAEWRDSGEVEYID